MKHSYWVFFWKKSKRWQFWHFWYGIYC